MEGGAVKVSQVCLRWLSPSGQCAIIERQEGEIFVEGIDKPYVRNYECC